MNNKTNNAAKKLSVQEESVMKNERILAEGITVSNNTRETGLNNNDLIIGSAGSGKTGGYVIPNLRNITGSLVVSDTKGQLSRMFSEELKQKGYKVATLDLANFEGTCGYNPFKGIRRTKSGRFREDDILSLANNIMPRLDAHDPFWEQSAAGIIAFYIAYALEALPEEEQDMMTICELHRAFIQPRGTLPFELWAANNPDSFAAKKLAQITAYLAADKMFSSIIEFANRALEPFDFAEAQPIFRGENHFDVTSLGKEKTVLFLNVSDTDHTFDRLVNIFHTQALQLLCTEADKAPDGRLTVPVRIIMDDFAASATIPDFEKTISIIRSREISVSLILQSLTQLETMYSSAASSTIIANCDHMLYLGCQDMETAEFIAKRMNRQANTILTMPRDKAILMTNGEIAREVNRIKPYSCLS